MKKRASIEYAEWSITKAGEYKKDCEEILYNKNWELDVTGNLVYLKGNGQKKILVEVTNPKTAWFEIWLKLRDI